MVANSDSSTELPIKPSSPHLNQETASSADALTTTILATNIHCGSCVSYIKEILRHVPGITSVEVSVLTEEVRVGHKPIVTASRICQSLNNAAFDASNA